jgi:hypothetical protein
MDITPTVEKFFRDNPGKNFCLPCVKKLNEINDYDEAISLDALWKTTWEKDVRVGVCSVCKKVEDVRKVDDRPQW